MVDMTILSIDLDKLEDELDELTELCTNLMNRVERIKENIEVEDETE